VLADSRRSDLGRIPVARCRSVPRATERLSWVPSGCGRSAGNSSRRCAGTSLDGLGSKRCVLMMVPEGTAGRYVRAPCESCRDVPPLQHTADASIQRASNGPPELCSASPPCAVRCSALTEGLCSFLCVERMPEPLACERRISLRASIDRKRLVFPLRSDLAAANPRARQLGRTRNIPPAVANPTHRSPHGRVQLRVACRKRDRRRQSARPGQ
jgi:hypothetical protein